jgi:uncharacterized membrane protein (DUF485 family)
MAEATPPKKKRGPYGHLFENLREYASRYGFPKSIFTSPFFHLSILLTILFAHEWLASRWWETVLSVLPNLLGFSLGGYAVIISLGDDGFRRLISSDDLGNSPYLILSASFLHFILVQITALTLALAAKALHFVPEPTDLSFTIIETLRLRPLLRLVAPAGDCVGFLLFVYAIAVAAATGLAVFRASRDFDRYIKTINELDPPGGK